MRVTAAIFVAAMSSVAAAAPGDLDTTFGTGGTASVSIGGQGSDTARALTVDSSGRLVVAGIAYSGQSTDMGVLRLLANGQPDSSFGTAGKTLLDLNQLSYDRATSIAIDASGNILLGGSSHNSTSGSLDRFVIARLTPTGAVDTAYGTQGHTFVENPTTGNDACCGIALDGGGSAYLVGSTISNSRQTLKIAKFTSAGCNASWGNQGTYTTTTLENASTNGVAAIADASGALYVAASVSPSGNADLALVKYDSVGNLDTAFQSGGASYADHDSFDTAASMTRDAKGNFFIVGRTGFSPQLIMIAKFDKNGALVAGFGSNGIAALSLPGHTSTFPIDIKADGDGNLYIGGSTTASPVAIVPVMIAVDGGTGTLRSDFGAQGYALVDTAEVSSAQAITLDPAHQRACIAHVRADSTPPSYFNVTCFKSAPVNEIFAAGFE